RSGSPLWRTLVAAEFDRHPDEMNALWIGIEHSSVIPGYTHPMKTAISVPDELFERVERLRMSHGMSRSQFFATAAVRFAAELESESLRAEIDRAAGIANAD